MMIGYTLNFNAYKKDNYLNISNSKNRLTKSINIKYKKKLTIKERSPI